MLLIAWSEGAGAGRSSTSQKESGGINLEISCTEVAMACRCSQQRKITSSIFRRVGGKTKRMHSLGLPVSCWWLMLSAQSLANFLSLRRRSGLTCPAAGSAPQQVRCCSSGVGRTGTIVCLFALTSSADTMAISACPAESFSSRYPACGTVEMPPPSSSAPRSSCSTIEANASLRCVRTVVWELVH